MELNNEEIKKHTPLVYHIVNKEFSYINLDAFSISKEDLFQTGCIGLIKAIRKFDESYGTKFSTYAYPLIEGEIQRELRDKLELIKFPRLSKEIGTKIKNNIINYNAAVPTVKEVMEEYNCNKKYAELAIDFVNIKILSKDKKVYQSDIVKTKVEDIIPIDYSLEDDVINKIELKQRLSILSEKERQVILLSLTGEYSQSEIGKILGYSQVSISRIIKRVLEKIQLRFDGKVINNKGIFSPNKKEYKNLEKVI